MEERKIEIRVMRLIPPSIENETILAKKEMESFEICTKNDLFLLPQTFGNLFLSEKLRCVLNVVNCSSESVRISSIKCEVQSSSSNIVVLNKEESILLEHKEYTSEIFNYTVKEIGFHSLICEVTYETNEGYEISKKSFKFNTKKPMKIETRSYRTELFGEAALEATVKNITKGPILLDKVEMIPHYEHMTAFPLNGEYKQLRLQPDDSFQFLFKIISASYLPKCIKLGKVEIIWRSLNFSKPVRLLTNQLEMSDPEKCDLNLTVDIAASSTKIAMPYEFICRLYNETEHPMDLLVKFNTREDNCKFTGSSRQRLGIIESNQSKRFKLTIFPTSVGIIEISSLKIIDLNCKNKIYEFENFLQVFVVQ
ncbi:hypothetical protein PVAND_000164 [Polypedilum vanderplanki]|uniref:Trafficking protein particle complex subunit 13-like protein n=1 Tax=Polypedilum vanderplanki TaxID=319348 RepID=A0A9J6BJ06_POLVA|nr:hypothetical protein PVAND_000164 [Polypedilum vanderplanki]